MEIDWITRDFLLVGMLTLGFFAVAVFVAFIFSKETKVN